MKPIISTEWLAERLGSPGLVVVEVSFETAERAAFFADGHIPGARHRWWKDLCWHDTDRLFPEPEVMARRLEELGVSDDSTVVLAGDPVQFATYVYWVLAMCGLAANARVLDGGRPVWVAEGLPISTSTAGEAAPGRIDGFSGQDVTSLVGRDEVRQHLGDPGRVLIDLRSEAEYRGERVAPPFAAFDHGAERAGHIPGAVHLPHERLLDAGGRFGSAEHISRQLDAAGATEDVEVVAYCRLSHRASLAWFCATHIAGRDNVRVYDGSWTEWGSIVGFPVER